MDDSIAHPSSGAGALALPAWKSALSVICAMLLAAVMLVAGIWKATDLIEAAARANQALIPADLSLPAAIVLAISETFAGILLLVPRFRRWGAILGAALLVAFMIYIAIFYNRLAGEECNCFPWVQRAVGPAFFIGDLVMLLLAVPAYLWAKPAHSRKSAALVFAAVCVFVGANLGIALTQPSGVVPITTIEVNGQPFNLHQGRVLLYFFDPECTHCLFAAQDMTGYQWNDVQIIAIPTERKRLADQFLEAAGLDAPLSMDSDKLREIWKFGDPPYGVALEDGHQLAILTVFEDDEPHETLAKLGFVK